MMVVRGLTPIINIDAFEDEDLGHQLLLLDVLVIICNSMLIVSPEPMIMTFQLTVVVV